MSSINLDEHDVYEIAHLTMKGWVCDPYGSATWSKEGQIIKDCHYHAYDCGGCTDCYERTDFTRDEAVRRQEVEDEGYISND